ncbi:putative oxidoreductase [Viridothelium virens]|uniref:Putative oxidoreductase n=1 Tax=Viridothelium virens TaxID=1048519 RepID=A0A6A6H0W2_VIRVR|nr:putative oxidoreductase [Viridothelium virens]
MSNLRILICGASVAGPTLAYFLAGSGAKVTIVERAPSLRKEGQNIDIRGVGIKVIRRMGVEDDIRKATTGEVGLRFVDERNKIRAEMPAEPGNSNSATSEIEILRGQLAQILVDKSKEKGVEYIFGDYVSTLDQEEHHVRVSFAKSTESKEYDLVIAADGQNSKTRALAFGEKANGCINSLGQYMMYFSMARGDTDSEWARWYNAPGRRCLLIRPDNTGTTRAVFAVISSDPALEQTLEGPIGNQKPIWQELFEDAGWESERALKGLDEAQDCYMQRVAQVKIPSWSCGRVVLAGDAGYCPSPVSGMGTTCALVGSYILAGEIIEHGKDFNAAFQGYEEKFRPFVDKAQKLVPGGPKLLNPETKFGITILNTTLGFMTATGLTKVVGKLAGGAADAFELPDYQNGHS